MTTLEELKETKNKLDFIARSKNMDTDKVIIWAQEAFEWDNEIQEIMNLHLKIDALENKLIENNEV